MKSLVKNTAKLIVSCLIGILWAVTNISIWYEFLRGVPGTDYFSGFVYTSVFSMVFFSGLYFINYKMWGNK